MEYGVYRAVTQFKLGSLASELDSFGMAGKKIIAKKDLTREVKSKRKAQ